MPLYSVRCSSCETEGSTKLSFAEYDEVKSGERVLPCECGEQAAIVFNPGDVSFVLKDGESGGWTSKAGKENAYRKRRAEHMRQRERDHVFKSELQPNYQGQETGTWKDAQELARTKTFEKVHQEHSDAGLAKTAADESAKTYQPLVNREVSR